jgi:hypothetical protein
MSVLKLRRISVAFAAIILAIAGQFMIRITPTSAETITYSYDSLNRLTMIKYYDSLFIVRYTYDAAGNRISTKAFMDSDMDGLPSELENTTCTEPNDDDTDDDGILDGDEDANANGVVDQGETNPCNPDSDGDGLKDGEEKTYMTSPLLSDTDGDGYQDGLEVQAGSSPTDNTSTPGIIYVCQDGTCSGKRPCRATIDQGVGAALVDATLRIAAGEYSGDVTLNNGRSMVLDGGWASNFGSQGGFSTVLGMIMIQNCRTEVRGIVVR